MTMRLACFHVVDLPFAAHRRARPELDALPAVVMEHAGAAARVVAASRLAREAGVVPGTGLGTARRASPGIEVLARDPELERHALEDLEAVAAQYAPAVALDDADGAVHVDATGVSGLFGGELGYAVQVLEALDARGLRARAGVASSRVVARARALASDPDARDPAARAGVVPAGEEAPALRDLPLACIGPSPEAAGLLEAMGLRTCGDLAALPARALRDRLEDEGDALRLRARGEDPSPFVPTPAPIAHRHRLELEQALDRRPGLAAATSACLARLLPPLVDAGLSVGAMRVVLELERGGLWLEVFELAQPTREEAPLLRLLDMRLERAPPGGAVSAVEVELRPDQVRPVQLSLFLPAGPSPRRLSRTVSRVEGLAGSRRVGHPAPLDDHRPAGYASNPFRVPRPGPPPAPGATGAMTRALRPPRPVRVRLEEGRPAWLEAGPRLGFLPRRARVERGAGPFEVSGGWWGERPFRRLYFDLELEGNLVVRVFLDRLGGRWWMDGIVD